MSTPETYSIDLPEINPLIKPMIGDTCRTAAAALAWIIDPIQHPDEDGLYYLVLPIVTALEAAAERADGCLMLDGDRTARLRALAADHTAGNLLSAFDQALDALEVAKTAARKIDETPEAQRARFERVRDLAQSWIDGLDQGEEVAP